ncbi:hypothetical protein [Oryzomicrobium sp.]|uniref:hypothetical protein n=1 Tax=Oryzomicrobium sp. TaxID=1911578 RepID=UPI002FE3DF99
MAGAGGGNDGSREALARAAALLEEVQSRLIALEALAALVAAEAGAAEEVDPRLFLCFHLSRGLAEKADAARALISTRAASQEA